MGWRLRVAKAAVVNRLPLRAQLSGLKRRLLGYSFDEDNLKQTVADYREMTTRLDAIGRRFADAVVLEIGSGWFPTIPLLLARDGVRHVYLSDLTPHMDDRTFESTLEFVSALDDWPASPARDFSAFPFSYLAPFDPAQLAERSLDFVISRTVLEHVPRVQLAPLLAELRAKLHPDGLMVHLIDHSDHLAHGDASMSMVNFLTWSPRTHRIVNRIAKAGENRLRHHEYRAVFEAAGYDVIAAHGEVHEPTRRQVATLRLASPYAAMEPDELAILRSIYVLGVR
jgi:SAM-dependent methyltransferase